MKELDLKKYYTFGLSMIQLMAVIGGSALIVTAIYHYCF